MRRGGFTLLEVVIAIVILATFAVACLQLRVNGLHAAKQIEKSQRSQRAIDDVLELAVNRMLPDPVVERDEKGALVRITWRGEHLGHAYECVSEVVMVPAPRLARAQTEAEPKEPAAATVRVQRYVVTIGGEKGELLLPVRGRA